MSDMTKSKAEEILSLHEKEDCLCQSSYGATVCDYELASGFLLGHAAGAAEEHDRLFKTISFFASVIKSGEPWTNECEAAYVASREVEK